MPKLMDFEHMFERVADCWPDDNLLVCWDGKGIKAPRAHGDTLALFVARDLFDVYDPEDEESVLLCIRSLQTAVRDLKHVIKALEELAPVPVCVKCGSEDVRRDADTAWDPQTRQWALCATYDNTTCEACGGETRLVLKQRGAQ